ncbi:helix-turn-helix domain-containing protein [Thiomicrorhabdus xiamenensis]|uniref:Helix-turn-helix domain-containing protein n=1 Tax=Thiomicrorhabdus xiamenensis TaxID=2739063 RepID=A0A7D4TFD1_9GAMM|nr:helix-turn-helix domain-containing protein [Thiomicrorhabdus xiamenensis]QKI88768.1 helix-turn-helix domain-containing protein [Thiomicrorhabdus xiamenensis]
MTQVDNAAAEKTIETIQLHELLRQTRESQHLTLEMASSQLNMSLDQLNFLESGDLDPLNLTPFERGYVRNYAAMLEIPSEKVESYFPSNTEVVSDLHSVQRYYSYDDQKPFFARAIGRLLIYTLGLAVIAAILWLVWPESTSTLTAEEPAQQLLTPQLPNTSESNAP